MKINYQPRCISVCYLVNNRLGFDTVIATELADPVVMEQSNIGGDIQCTMPRDELPDEVVACLNNKFWFANILRALLVRVKLRFSACLAECYEVVDYWSIFAVNCVVIRPLEVEKCILERVGGCCSQIQFLSKPSVKKEVELMKQL